MRVSLWARWSWPVLGLLAACGGDSGSDPGPVAPPPPVASADPGGIFFGDLNGCSVCPVDLIMLVSEAGQWIAADVDFLEGASVGAITVDGITFTSTRQLYTRRGREYGYPPTAPAQRDTPNEARSFVGTVSPRASIQGTFIHGVGAPVSATYNDEYDKDSSLASLEGTYTVSDTTGFTLTYAIDAGGALMGSDSDGCMASGQASVIDAAYNMYAMEIDFSQCGADGAQGRFSGMATLLAPGLWLYGVNDDETQLVILALPRI